MIEVKNLTKNFGTFEAVKGIDLTVPTGELFCFLGPNGAGKTTTIKMMCGLLRPTTGSVKVGGIDIHEDPVAVRKITGYIPDMPYLYDRLSAAEFYHFTGDLYQIPREKVDEEMEESFTLFGLKEHQHNLIKDLSHGLRQRLIYAASFLHEPQVLFVDEPFVGLDPYTIRLTKDLLRRKTAAGMTIFLTTHILALAEDLADRIGIIVKGEIVAIGGLEELAAKSETSGRLEDAFLALTM